MTMSRSAVTWALASGRWTLSTTEVPSRRAPLWTCATDAAASGSSSTPAKTSGIGRPSSDSTALATTGHGDAGTSDCSCASSRANAGPMRSGRVASIWPSLTNVTPPSASASRTDRATPESVSPAGTRASAAKVSTEAVPRRDGEDLRIPAAPTPPCGDAAHPRDGPGQ